MHVKALPPVPPCHILRFAACQGVLKTTFDNEAELHKISRSHPSAELLVRIRADDPDAVINLGVKFGASVLQACHLLDVAKEMNLNVVGIRYACVCVHVCVVDLCWWMYHCNAVSPLPLLVSSPDPSMRVLGRVWGRDFVFALFISPASTSAVAARMLVPTAVPLRWHTKCSPMARVLA